MIFFKQLKNDYCLSVTPKSGERCLETVYLPEIALSKYPSRSERADSVRLQKDVGTVRAISAETDQAIVLKG